MTRSDTPLKPFLAQEPFDERGRPPSSQRYEEARRLMAAELFDQAIELFQLSAVDAPHFKTYELLGECYIHLKRLNEAVPFLAAATTLNRGVRAPSLLAQTWLSLQQYHEAIEASDIALSRDPNNKAALQVREKALAAQTKTGDSI